MKITVSVGTFEGERLAKVLKMQPFDVVDAYGRCAKQIQTEDKVIAIEWLAPKSEETFGGAPANWSARPAEPPKPPKST